MEHEQSVPSEEPQTDAEAALGESATPEQRTRDASDHAGLTARKQEERERESGGGG
jgi:hypothetical protein